jgi:uncharacterized protein YdeI (YjbR/CyaY-like superfamily)
LVAEFRKWNWEWSYNDYLLELSSGLQQEKDWPLLKDLWAAVVACYPEQGQCQEVIPPADFRRMLKTTPGTWEHWHRLSYTHQREHVDAIEGAKKPETRARRIEAAIRMIQRLPKAREA